MAAARQVKQEEVKEEEKKEEEDADSKVRHSHQFTVKFSNEDVEYTIDCDQPRTVLEVIKSHPNEQMKDNMKGCSASQIIIQLSDQSSIATHFPCSCIKDKENLTIDCQVVEKTQNQPDEILPRDKYSVFYVSKEGGENMTQTKFLRCNPGRNIKYVRVYAKKGTSVKEALERDGRFVGLEDFKLLEVENSEEPIQCTERVDNLDQKKFKIGRERKKAKQQEQPSTSPQSQQKLNTKSMLDAAQKSGAMEKTGSQDNTEKICDLLCKLFEELKIWKESRLHGDSYQKALEPKEDDSGNI